MAYTTINKSTDYFNPIKYTGNASSSRDITGVGFQPDFTWIKDRDGGYSHILGNAVSGNNKFLASSATSAESTDSTKFRTFVSDGFQVGNHNGVNANSNDYASWNWKAGGAVSGNTTGSGTSKAYTGSINGTSGFSIIRYQGNGTSGHTIPHRLAATPSMIIVKRLSAANNWSVYHKDAFTSQAAPGVLYLNTTAAKSNDTNVWGTSSVTINSTVFSVGDYSGTNANNSYYIAYVFAEKQGYNKFGSYVGNGNVNGTFVYTGFKPAFVLAKKTNEANTAWIMLDNKRANSFNPIGVRLFANLDAAESTSSPYCDFLSNGFKFRTTDNNSNDANDTYIYMSFAEAPLVGTNNVPANAR